MMFVSNISSVTFSQAFQGFKCFSHLLTANVYEFVCIANSEPVAYLELHV